MGKKSNELETRLEQTQSQLKRALDQLPIQTIGNMFGEKMAHGEWQRRIESLGNDVIQRYAGHPLGAFYHVACDEDDGKIECYCDTTVELLYPGCRINLFIEAKTPKDDVLRMLKGIIENVKADYAPAAAVILPQYDPNEPPF